MKNRILNFKENKVERLNLNELKSSVSETRITGNPIHGVQHHELLQAIDNRIKKSKLDYKLQPISVTDGGPKATPGVTTFDDKASKRKEGSIESFLFRRLITMFLITSNNTEEYNYGLAVAFHQNGIQVAYGPNVRVCDNMCILSGQNLMQSYGQGKIKPEKILEVVGEWLTDFEKHRKRDIQILERMKEIQCTYRDVAELVGHLTFMRVADSSKEIATDVHQPLTQSQITIFTDKYLQYYKDKIEMPDNDISLYELFNLATNMHKAGLSDLPVIMQANFSLGKFLIDKYKLAEETTQKN